MATGNWYQALCNDLGIDLIDLHKKFVDSLRNRVTDKTLRTYRATGDIPTREAVKTGILELIQKQQPDFTREQLESYWNTNKTASSSGPDPCLIDAALKDIGEEDPLTTTLKIKLGVTDISAAAASICAIIAAGDGSGRLMGLLGEPLKKAIEQTQSLEGIEQIETLLGSVILTTVRREGKISNGGEFKIVLKHDDELWTLRVLVDAHRSYPTMTGITLNRESQLEANGVAKLGIGTSGTTGNGRLLELHRAVSLITDHLCVLHLQCPNLYEANSHREFYDFARLLRNELIATNDEEGHILACIGEDASDELKSDLIDYFTDDDGAMALRLVHISKQIGHQPLRVKAGPFGSWLAIRLRELKTQRELMMKDEAEHISIHSGNWVDPAKQVADVVDKGAGALEKIVKVGSAIGSLLGS